MSLVLYESLSKHVGRITLNDPDRLNAMGEEMAREFSELVQRLRAWSGLRALILTGAGRAFSAGGDLQMLKGKAELSGEENRKIMLQYYNSFLSILSLQVPIVVALNGHAVGAGLCVAAACDIRVAAKSAKLGLTFTKLGLHPGMGATYSFARVMGYARAAELMLTARVVTAEEALTMGLVGKVVEDTALTQTAEGIANEIAACGPEATRQLLETLRANPTSLSDALQREALAQSINYASKEFIEGVSSAIEKRGAKF
jgi:enoyl-CoA hydratase/carnithine racemase